MSGHSLRTQRRCSAHIIHCLQQELRGDDAATACTEMVPPVQLGSWPIMPLARLKTNVVISSVHKRIASIRRTNELSAASDLVKKPARMCAHVSEIVLAMDVSAVWPRHLWRLRS